MSSLLRGGVRPTAVWRRQSWREWQIRISDDAKSAYRSRRGVNGKREHLENDEVAKSGMKRTIWDRKLKGREWEGRDVRYKKTGKRKRNLREGEIGVHRGRGAYPDPHISQLMHGTRGKNKPFSNKSSRWLVIYKLSFSCRKVYSSDEIHSKFEGLRTISLNL